MRVYHRFGVDSRSRSQGGNRPSGVVRQRLLCAPLL